MEIGKSENNVLSMLECSLELISLAYQSWYIVFLSQQNSISRLISRRNHQPNSSYIFVLEVLGHKDSRYGAFALATKDTLSATACVVTNISHKNSD